MATAVGLDENLEITHRARKILFTPQSMQLEKAVLTSPFTPSTSQPLSVDPSSNSTAFPDELAYSLIETKSGSFGYLRIRSFNVVDYVSFVGEVIRILEMMPRSGLVIDVRGNPGGNILAGESLLQLFTDKKITPELFHFRNTQMIGDLAKLDYLKQWRNSIDLSLSTGSVMSQGQPISVEVNTIGRKYYGKSILLTDSACYSTTDIFAAGYQDHEIGTILGYDNTTGAGGANVWTIELLRQQWPEAAGPNPFIPLPRGISMRVALRQSSRCGVNSGLPLEDLGAISDQRAYRTQRDVFENDADLLDLACQILKSQS
jgi:hypothetical protein